MTGVTVRDGKYAFVRGLGERYSRTALNGSPLPSPEPEREVVPLDLFPAGFLESLRTQKSHTAGQPSDFSGGGVQLRPYFFRQFTPYSEATPLSRSFDLSMGGSSDRFSDRQVGFPFAGLLSACAEGRSREGAAAEGSSPDGPGAVAGPPGTST